MSDEYKYTNELWELLAEVYGNRASLFYCAARDGGPSVLSIAIMRE
jgi:hypothetical protein